MWPIQIHAGYGLGVSGLGGLKYCIVVLFRKVPVLRYTGIGAILGTILGVQVLNCHAQNSIKVPSSSLMILHITPGVQIRSAVLHTQTLYAVW